MKRYVSGLNQASASPVEDLPSGLFLVRIERAQYRWHAQKPYFAFVFSVLEPRVFTGNRFNSRLYCTPKALWKLNWFLRDFGYDSDLLAKGEVDDRALVGLQGVIKVSYAMVRGLFVLNLDGFAPAEKWKELSPLATEEPSAAEVA